MVQRSIRWAALLVEVPEVQAARDPYHYGKGQSAKAAWDELSQLGRPCLRVRLLVVQAQGMVWTPGRCPGGPASRRKGVMDGETKRVDKMLRELEITSQPGGPTRQAAHAARAELARLSGQVDGLVDAREKLVLLVPVGLGTGTVEQNITDYLQRLEAEVERLKATVQWQQEAMARSADPNGIPVLFRVDRHGVKRKIR